MQPFYDPSQFLKYGTVGVLLLIVLAVLSLGAYAIVKVAGALIQKLNGSPAGPARNGALAASEQARLLHEAQQRLDELRAGSQSVEFWAERNRAIANSVIQPVLRHQEEILRNQALTISLLRELQESQRRIRERFHLDDQERS